MKAWWTVQKSWPQLFPWRCFSFHGQRKGELILLHVVCVCVFLIPFGFGSGRDEQSGMYGAPGCCCFRCWACQQAPQPVKRSLPWVAAAASFCSCHARDCQCIQHPRKKRTLSPLRPCMRDDSESILIKVGFPSYAAFHNVQENEYISNVHSKRILS